MRTPSVSVIYIRPLEQFSGCVRRYLHVFFFHYFQVVVRALPIMSSLELEDNAVFPDCDSDSCITAAPEQEKRAKFYIEDEHDMVSFNSIWFNFRKEL